MTDVQKNPYRRSSTGVMPSARRMREEGERRTERTRDRIRDAAHRLFTEHGIENTTVDAICSAAGISKGSFYLYFHRKEDLLLEYALRRLRRVREMLPELIGRPTFGEAINAILDEVVRGRNWSREVTERSIFELGTCAERLSIEPPHRLVQPLIEIGQARGEIRKDIPPDALAHFVLRSILGALRDWGVRADERDRETVLDYTVTLVLDAIQTRH